MDRERNVKLIIEYDGADYFGWQRQPRHVTVQQRLEEAVEAVTQAPASVIGSGRTDTGVHARGQVANFRTRSAIPAEKLPFALNAHLPRDIAVLAAEDAPWEFHARYDATSKLYRYAKDAVYKARQYEYRDRKKRKGQFRRLWIQRISAACRERGLTYSRFMEGLNAAGVQVDRKILADLAVHDAAAFDAIFAQAKAALESKAA